VLGAAVLVIALFFTACPGPDDPIDTETGYTVTAQAAAGGSLRFEPAGGSAGHVTAPAEFETKTAGQLVAAGTEALADGNFDAAVDAFKSACRQDPANTEAAVYRTGPCFHTGL
jgi:hypothetical protein